MSIEKHCSFCGKSEHHVPKLIAGPSVFICNECVDLCAEVIATDPGVSVPTAADRKWAWERAQEITLAQPGCGPQGDGWIQMVADRILAWAFPQPAAPSSIESTTRQPDLGRG